MGVHQGFICDGTNSTADCTILAVKNTGRPQEIAISSNMDGALSRFYMGFHILVLIRNTYGM